MKQISNKEYEKYQQYQTDKLHGRILTPDGLRIICAGLDNDPEKIGIHMLEITINRKWTASVFRGKYTARRMLQTILDLLLLVFMIAQPLSGILMSKYLYTVIQIDNVSAAAREIHLFLGYWGFVLMSIHLGLHMDMMLPAAFRGKAFGRAAVLGVSLYGVYAFIRRELPAYMFRQTIFAFFDYGEPILFFLLDYLAIMILFAALGYGTGSFLRLFSKQKKV